MVDRETDRARGTILGLSLGAPGREGGESELCLGFASALASQAIHGPARLIRGLTATLLAWGAGPGAAATRRLTSPEAARRLRDGARLSGAALPWSKESGSEVRGAVAGLVFCDHPALLAEVSAMLASSTHGHPTAAATSAMIADWTARALGGLPPALWPRETLPGADPVASLEWSEALGSLERAVEAEDDRAAMETLGEGWVSEEATAMALAALLRHPDRFEDALACAVDHDGDRGAVGRIVGALAGARLGASALPVAGAAGQANGERLSGLADALIAARLGLGAG